LNQLTNIPTTAAGESSSFVNSYRLFIDDIRDPIDSDWVIARSSKEAYLKTKVLGFPQEIAFDHDLGGDDTTLLYLYRVTGDLMDGNLSIPVGFKYSIHSSNPYGADRIRSEMELILFHFGPKHDD